MSGFVTLKIDVEGWGKITFLRVLPHQDDNWGVLRSWRGTPWEVLVTVVSGEDLSHALHGYPWPLIKSLGPPTEVLYRHLSEEHSFCLSYQDKSCSLRQKGKCLLGKNLQPCYVPPCVEDRVEFQEALLALKEGQYLLVTEGQTFSL